MNEEKSLAYEMLQELKKSSKRWFIIAIMLFVGLIGSNVAWLIYESQYSYVDETSIQTVEDTTLEDAHITQY